MVKRVIWSLKTQEDRRSILNYWRQRNGSITYSKKLNYLFKEAIRIIQDFPEIGKLTDQKDIRIKIVRDYFIIYEYTGMTICILAIWDSRQDPSKLDNIIR